jgi:hypothetical protein
MDAGAEVERIVVYNSLGENVLEFQPELFTKKISVDFSVFRMDYIMYM